MDPEDILLCAALISTAATVAVIEKKKVKKEKRRLWTKKWLQRRETGCGVLSMLNNELLDEDRVSYKNYLRLSNEQFENLLRLIAPDLTKSDTVMRDSLPARSKLEVTLRFLATGDSYRSLMYATRIHESTLSRFIPDVCKTIYKHLRAKYLKTPSTVDEWTAIADDFNRLWQFPHCLGALDGRHIKFRPPRSDGSYYYNYKGDHSIVLLGLADANYKFTYVNVGVNGRISDGGVFRDCGLSKALGNNHLNFPASQTLPERRLKVPYVIIADDAFPLSERLLKPYPQRELLHDCKVFNYRLSRARRIIENSFGILANRFRVLLNPINLRAEKVEVITLACIVLHNFLATENGALYTNSVPNEFENIGLQVLGRQGGNRSTSNAQAVRNEFRDYFCSPSGAVDWQETAILRNNL